VLLVLLAPAAAAQEVLDRVIARVNGEPITLSDARAALGLGIVERPSGVDPILSALRQLVERRLVLAEVARFAPPEPAPAALDREVAALKARVGGPEQLTAFEQTTGVGDLQIREIARDTLRMQAYLTQRFGSSVQASDEEAAEYYRTHQDEFRVNGQLTAYADAQADARQKAAAERRRVLIFQWMRELRQRADVVEMYR
jgi:hypothetical protein